MGKVKALLVGVSEYNADDIFDLSYCINDVEVMRDALITGLNLNEKDIWYEDTTGNVTYEQYAIMFQRITDSLGTEDAFILYFTGHGSIRLDDMHFLQFSDKEVPTQDIIDDLSEVGCKYKVFIIDSCFAGSFDAPYNELISTSEYLSELVGKGCAIFASSNSLEKSRFDNEVSIFTRCIADALNFRALIRKGKKSLNEIQKLIFMLMDIWNRNKLHIQQHPIFKKSIYGDVFFDVKEYIPYVKEEFTYESEEYSITEVSPVHHGLAKIYSVMCILKSVNSWDEIALKTLEIKDKIADCEIYQNENAEKRHKGKNPNIVWVYFGYDSTDMVNNNYICHTTWTDVTMDKEQWYKEGKMRLNINNVNINIHEQYNFIKKFNKENQYDEKTYIGEMKPIVWSMIGITEKYIALFEEYLQEEIDEDELIEKVQIFIKGLDNLNFKSTELSLSPDQLKEYDQKNQKLITSMFNLTYAYKKGTIYDTRESRKNYMKTYIKHYYQDLEKLK